jgi:hypothetical protein
MGGLFSIFVKFLLAYYVYRLLKKIVLGEDPDLASVNQLLDVDSIGEVNLTASSFVFFHVLK